MKHRLVMLGSSKDSPGGIIIRVDAFVHIKFPTLYPELVVHTHINVGDLSRMR